MNDMYTNEFYGVSFRTHVIHTFAWMFLGVLITFLVAFAIGTSYNLLYTLVTIPGIQWILLIAQLGVVFAFSAGLMKFNPVVVKILFIAYSILTGITFSYLPLLFGVRSIASAFLACCIFYACLVIIGFTTKLDLTKIGNICMAALFAMVIYSVFALLFQWNMNTLVYSAIGLVVFVGITAWDAQKMKNLYCAYAHDEGMLQRLSIYSALQLYLDFINIFLYIIRLMGRKD